LIVLIANAHPRNPKDCRFQRNLEEIVAIRAIPEELSPEPDPVRDPNSMSLTQKDQLLEIGSRVRLGKPIICKGLSVPGDKSQTFRLMKFEQIFSLRCQTEQAAS